MKLEKKSQQNKSREVHFSAEMFSIVPIEHLQVVCNGKIARELRLDPDRTSAQVDGSIPIDSSGWCVLRAFSDKAEHPILDIYPYATTSPIYITVEGSPLHSPADAAYFVAWMDRLTAAVQTNTSWNTEAEKRSVLNMLEEARKRYEVLAK
jgi:hypothetical protein